MLTEKAPEETQLDPLRNTTLLLADRMPPSSSSDVIISLEGLGIIARHYDLPIFFIDSVKDVVKGEAAGYSKYIVRFKDIWVCAYSDPVKIQKKKKLEKKEVQ